MKIDNYSDLEEQCKNIIKNNTPEKSLEKISNLKIYSKNNIIGKDDAIKIYKCLSDSSIEWDNSKYSNNIRLYKKKINSNINRAIKHAKNI